mmetsp:Transcript_8522/g.22812  ORF Transcript_8522/g.22812 Transcript_8522/m.22812 type:complete len:249 (-) Transcript_8522:137-883(-)
MQRGGLRGGVCARQGALQGVYAGAEARNMVTILGCLHRTCLRVGHSRLAGLTCRAGKLEGLLAGASSRGPTGVFLELIISPNGGHALPVRVCVAALALNKFTCLHCLITVRAHGGQYFQAKSVGASFHRKNYCRVTQLQHVALFQTGHEAIDNEEAHVFCTQAHLACIPSHVFPVHHADIQGGLAFGPATLKLDGNHAVCRLGCGNGPINVGLDFALRHSPQYHRIGRCGAVVSMHYRFRQQRTLLLC